MELPRDRMVLRLRSIDGMDNVSVWCEDDGNVIVHLDDITMVYAWAKLSPTDIGTISRFVNNKAMVEG